MGTIIKHKLVSIAIILAFSGAMSHINAMSANFELHNGMRDTLCSDHATGTGIAVSVLACGNRCHVTDHCTGFFYNRVSRVCTMVKVIAIPQTGCHQEVSTNYYVKIVAGLFDGYTWTAADLALLGTGTGNQSSACTSYPYHVVNTDLGAAHTHGCPAGFTCCKTKGCYPVTSQHYTGTWSRTDSGRKCQAWNQQTPHAQWFYLGTFPAGENYVDAINYCRDPDYGGIMGYPWCYTTDPNVRWERCTIPRC